MFKVVFCAFLAEAKHVLSLVEFTHQKVVFKNLHFFKKSSIAAFFLFTLLNCSDHNFVGSLGRAASVEERER